MAKHPGFKKVEEGIERREGVSREEAGAMLASSTRRASAKAKKKNPRLKRVKGKARRNEYSGMGDNYDER